MTLHIDIETYSSVNIKDSGAYEYANSLDFQILMLAYAYEDNPPICIDLAAGEKLPSHIIDALQDEDTELSAHNAAFERICLAAAGYPTLISKWKCTMAKAAYNGLPLGLGGAANALGLGQKKDLRGNALIRYFSIPCKPTKTNGGRMRNMHYHDPEKWEEFKEYCRQDVMVERAIDRATTDLPQYEKQIYIADQIINDNGVLIDKPFVSRMLKINNTYERGIKEKLKELTGLENPNSGTQMRHWLEQRLTMPISSLAKDVIPDLMLVAERVDPVAKEVLELRQGISKSSNKKYITLLKCRTAEGRGHGFLQYYGAARTGRWAGRLVQVQNLPKTDLEHPEADRDNFLYYNMQDLNAEYGHNLPNVASKLIRTAIIAGKGRKLCVADFSAIEARVLSWLANESWRMDVFNGHGKIYEESASRMFGVPLSDITKDSPWRARGKVAELALGYQGSVGALRVMGGEKLGLNEAEMENIVSQWRAASPNIVEFWRRCERACIAAINNKGNKMVLHKNQNITFQYVGHHLTVKLPSGRKLYYQNPGLHTNQWNRPAAHYNGGIQGTGRYGRIETYGGKLTENIVQAISRDLLAESILRLYDVGMKVVMHVHDEVVAEEIEERAEEAYEMMCKVMEKRPSWAETLPLKVAGYTGDFYKKD